MASREGSQNEGGPGALTSDELGAWLEREGLQPQEGPSPLAEDASLLDTLRYHSGLGHPAAPPLPETRGALEIIAGGGADAGFEVAQAGVQSAQPASARADAAGAAGSSTGAGSSEFLVHESQFVCPITHVSHVAFAI